MHEPWYRSTVSNHRQERFREPQVHVFLGVARIAGLEDRDKEFVLLKRDSAATLYPTDQLPLSRFPIGRLASFPGSGISAEQVEQLISLGNADGAGA